MIRAYHCVRQWEQNACEHGSTDETTRSKQIEHSSFSPSSAESWGRSLLLHTMDVYLAKEHLPGDWGYSCSHYRLHRG